MSVAEAVAWVAVCVSLTQAVVFHGTSFREEHVCELQNGLQGVCKPARECVTRGTNQRLNDCLIEGTNDVCCPPSSSVPDRKAASKSKLKCEELSKLGQHKRSCPAVRPFDGDNRAVPQEFPHLAVLGYHFNKQRKDFRWLCAGVLVSSRFVLTVASCAIGDKLFPPPPAWVRLGDLDLVTDIDTNHVQTIPVAETILHPMYNRTLRYHDIALLKLTRDVELNKWVRPACLHTESTVAASRAVVAGWGTTGMTPPVTNMKLRKVDLPFIPADKCNQLWRNKTHPGNLPRGLDHETMLCAGDIAGGKDVCSGDSGTPLQVKLAHPYCTYSIVGLTSFGKNLCAAENTATVFTRVSHYIPWIDNIVWAEA